jgi:hypothetical protein
MAEALRFFFLLLTLFFFSFGILPAKEEKE